MLAGAGSGAWLAKNDDHRFGPPGSNPTTAGSDESDQMVESMESPPQPGRITIDGNVCMLAFSRGANVLAVGAREGDFRLYRTVGYANTVQLARDTSAHAVFALDFSPAGAMLAAGTSSNGSTKSALRVWFERGGEWATSITLPSYRENAYGDVLAVGFSPDGETLVIGDSNNRLVAWNVTDWTPTLLMLYAGAVTGIAFSSDRTLVISGDNDAAVTLLTEPYSDPEKRRELPDSEGTSTIAMSPDGTVLAAAADSGDINLWNLDRPEDSRPQTILHRESHVRCMTFSEDGKALAVGDDAGNAELWCVAGTESQRLRLWRAHQQGVRSVRFLPDRVLATSSDDHTVLFWGPL